MVAGSVPLVLPVEDAGARSETFVACHLLKAVEGWNDVGLGRFDLGYLRDKEKREVDFSAHRGYGSVAATASAMARVRRAAAITGRSMSLPSTSRTPPDCCS